MTTHHIPKSRLDSCHLLLKGSHMTSELLGKARHCTAFLLGCFCYHCYEITFSWSGVVVHICNLGTREVEVGLP